MCSTKKKIIIYGLVTIGMLLLIGIVIYILTLIPIWVYLLLFAWFAYNLIVPKGSGSFMAVWLGASLLGELLSTKKR